MWRRAACRGYTRPVRAVSHREVCVATSAAVRCSWIVWLLAACAAPPPLLSGYGRSIWIDRWDYAGEGDIERAIDDCHRAGFTAVLFQVRGNGTVAYPSSIEVWSERFGHRDPGFDPLAVALRAARARGMELHAWVNVVPGWSGVEDPADPGQLWRRQPGWFLQDGQCRPQRRAPGRYLALNPCLPEVRAYLADVCREIASRYAVDGIHLDYVRFPDPEPGGRELGTDPATLNLFSAASGRPAADRDALHRWQAACVTRLVADIGAAVRAARPSVRLTAAVFADPADALAKVRQEWPLWCRRGLVDAVFPMNYTGDGAQFASRARRAVAAAHGVPVVMGIGLYKLEDAAQGREQLDAALAAGASGVAVFSHRALFGAERGADPERQARLRADLGSWNEAAAAGRESRGAR